jgi:hypothetical protein
VRPIASAGDFEYNATLTGVDGVPVFQESVQLSTGTADDQTRCRRNRWIFGKFSAWPLTALRLNFMILGFPLGPGCQQRQTKWSEVLDFLGCPDKELKCGGWCNA